MIDNELRTVTESGLQVVGRLLGNENSGKLIICSHGFGVLSDSHGMYNVICETFKDTHLTARFHYVSVDDFTNSTYVYEFSRQVEKIKTVYDKIVKKFDIKEIIIISHSQGCIVTSLYLKKYLPKVDKVILLSFPPSTDIVKKMLSFFGKRVGSKVNLGGLSEFTRSNGMKTFVPADFWKEAKIINSIELYQFVEKSYHTYFVRATNDTVVNPAEYKDLKLDQLKNYYELPGDHDYKKDKRVGLLTLLDKII